jgi:predicted metal-binding protein
MLVKILETIATGQIHSPTELARKMDISEALLNSMMYDLANRGYLAPLSLADQGSCSSCEGCSFNKPNQAYPMIGALTGQGWILTSKGLALVNHKHSK